MIQRLEFLEVIRKRIGRTIHEPLTVFGGFAERPMKKGQYVCTVTESYEDLEMKLISAGFIRNLPSSVKIRRYATPPEVQVATWAYFPDGLVRSDRMLDIELFVGPDDETTDVYAHTEPSWFRHPIRHYSANHVDALAGVNQALDLFDENDISYAFCGVEERYTHGVDGCRLP